MVCSWFDICEQTSVLAHTWCGGCEVWGVCKWSGGSLDVPLQQGRQAQVQSESGRMDCPLSELVVMSWYPWWSGVLVLFDEECSWEQVVQPEFQWVASFVGQFFAFLHI